MNNLQTAVEALTTAEVEAFRTGAMKEAPCFKCGYNGPDYYRPTVHKCAEHHHRLNGATRADAQRSMRDLAAQRRPR